jgi:hypothetical protein
VHAQSSAVLPHDWCLREEKTLEGRLWSWWLWSVKWNIIYPQFNGQCSSVLSSYSSIGLIMTWLWKFNSITVTRLSVRLLFVCTNLPNHNWNLMLSWSQSAHLNMSPQSRTSVTGAIMLPRLTAVGIRHSDHVPSSIRKKLAITSPTSGGLSVGIVRSRTQTMEFSFSLV